MTMQHRIITAAYHRNGVGGAGFHVAIVESAGEAGDGRFLCIDFSGDPENSDYDPSRFAVLRMDELKRGNIGMHEITDPDGNIQEGTGGNAWRGADYWGGDLSGPISDWVSAGVDAQIKKYLAEQENKEA